ncbi:hypothetical protein KKB28_06945, partial [bacterium]|nr:hypothetical protein [bacterium]
SGTVEEIETFRKAGKPVMLYFCTKPVVPDSIELDEYARLKDFKAQCVKEGLIEKYDDVGELREKLQRQITTTVRELRGTNLPISNVQGDEQISDNEITVQQNALKTFRSNFETFLREFEADWIAERDSEPYNIEDGQYILDHACSEVIHFKSQIVNDSDGRLSEVLIDTAKQLKSLKRHHVYADGGRSFRDFWKKGDEVIEKLKGVPTIVDNVLANADTGN